MLGQDTCEFNAKEDTDSCHMLRECIIYLQLQNYEVERIEEHAVKPPSVV